MTSPRPRVVFLCLVAIVGVSAPSQAAIGIKLRPGDTCTVTTEEAPVKKGGRVVATLTKGDRVKIVKVYGRTMVRAEVEVDGATVAVLMKTADLALDESAPRGDTVAPKRTRKPKKVEADEEKEEAETDEEEDEDEQDDAEEEKKPRRRREGRKKSESGGTWAQFRGPNRDGSSPETGLLKRWPSGGPKLLWQAEGCGVGYASVSIGDGLIYTAGNVGDALAVVAFDMEGNRKWQADVDAAYSARSYPGSRSTPTYDDGRLYVGTPSGEIVCVDAGSGKKVWSISMTREFGARNIGWCFAESLLVDGDRVFCSPGGSRACFVALDKRNGRPKWVTPGIGDPAGHASAVLVEDKGVNQILTMTGFSAIGIDPKSGQLLWQVAHKNKCKVNATTPVYHDGHVFFTSGYGLGAACVRLRGKGKRVSAREAWQESALDNHHGGVVLVDGHIYGHGNRGGWMCIDLRSGNVKYRDRQIEKGAVVYADGMLYCLSEKAKRGQDVAMMHLVRATPDQFDVVSSFPVPNAASGQKDVWAHPVVCGGRLYIRNKDLLFAYDIKK